MFKQGDKPWGNICERVDTCALTGAAAFIAGIPGAETLVNGPLWCYFYALRYLEHSDYSMAQRMHGSQPDNTAVVYGAEKYILETLARLQKQGLEPELLFIESSCSMSLIGDDLNGIANKAQLPFPFVAMDCGGLVGGFAEGYAKAALAVLEKFLSKNDEPTELAVNILGQTYFYLHGRDDTKELRRLLHKAGYQVQAVLGSGGTLEQLKHLGRAQLNIVTNEELGLPLAQYLEQQLGTPYILAGLPYGVQGTKAWLEKIANALPAPTLDAVLAEADAAQEYITSWLNDACCQWGALWFDRVMVSAPPTQALCLAQALRREWVDTSSLEVYCQRQLPKSELSAYCK
ncbi:MAG: nitrogenase component 1, partial [Phascolarctobacterium sp.]